MADIITVTGLEIRKMPDGGYIVGDGQRDYGDYRMMRFASTSIDDALKYIKGNLEPKPESKAK